MATLKNLVRIHTWLMGVKGDVMRNKSVLIKRWIGFIIGVSILTISGSVTLGQACSSAGCWERHEPIYIYGNNDFTCENGVASGSGSQYDPYIIEGWHIIASGASYGINVEHVSKNFVIRNCIIEGASGAGVHFYATESGSIESCHLLRNERGILFESSRNNAIVSNLIAENHYGVDLVLGTRDTAVSKNSFVNNGRNGYDPGGRNIWYCGAVGNYWSDYAGSDRDCDGIGDVPHHAPVDRYPLMASPWQCALPVNDVCGLHCDDSTQILKTIGTPTGPCATPCVPASSCTSTPRCTATTSCATPCEPAVTTCIDQILTCANPVATLSAEFCPSRPTCQPCSIQWVKDGGAVVGTGSVINVSESGIYTVSVVGADGCAVSRSVAVVSDINAPSVHATVKGELSCSVDQVQVEATISGGCAPYNIQWSRSGTGVLGRETCLLVSVPGTYTVTVTGANGCSTFDTVVVEQDLQAPRVSAIVDGELSCSVKQAKLTALASNGQLPYRYEWRSPSGTLVGTSSETYVSQPGTYTIVVVGNNGCSALNTVIVTEDAGPPAVDVSVSGTLTCTNTDATLLANISHGRPPYHIEWIGPSGNLVGTAPLLTVTTPGMYTVTVTGMNGCATSKSATVIQDIVAPSVDAGSDQLLSNEVTQVSIAAIITSPSGPYAVAWTNELGDILSTTADITIDRPGEYTVTVTRNTGCTASDTVSVNSEIITEVMLNSGIEGLAVFGQLTLDGVPIPETTFHFLTESIEDTVSGVDISSISIRTGAGEGHRANGAEVNYIIPGNSVVTFQVHRDQFVAGKWYNLPHLPIDPPGTASVKFF